MSSQEQRTTKKIKQKVNSSFVFYVKIFQYMYRLYILFKYLNMETAAAHINM
jgi:hypothetical protein